MLNSVQRHCISCGVEFQATRAWQKFCSQKCKERKRRKNLGLFMDTGRYCKQCATHFMPETAQQQHCSVECSVKSARQSRSKFLKRNPDAPKLYYKKSREKFGKDSNLARLYRRYPDLAKECESCGDDRVLDIAHKPMYKRNGAWRSVKNTTREKIWILCPTCHALIDRKGYDPRQLNLK